MEPKTDINRPSTIRIIAGILVLLCTFPISGICLSGIDYLIKHYPARKFLFFEYLWGKLLIVFISGTIFLALFGVITIFLLIAMRIWSGKREKVKHIIYPFPAVLTTEIADFYKVERADDQFLIFTTPSEIRGFLIGIGAAILCTGIFLFCKEIDNPYSEIYWPPFSGAFILAPFILLVSQVFAHKRRFVLDRMNGTVTFPRHLFFPRCTVPFSEVIPGYSKGTMNLAFRFCFLHPRTKAAIPVLAEYDSDWWPFYVLYMDKNRPLPQGEAFDPYREKDFLRRKAAGFPKPIYPSISLVTDAYMGYIYGTDEFKQRLTKMKHGIIHCYTRVSWYCQKNEIKYENPNDLVLVGLWKKQFVFKLFAPENVEYIVIPDNTVLTDCFLCDSETDEVKYIK